MASLLARLFPPSFLPERDIPDLSGKIALVTGGNSGIGYQTVKQLLLKGAKVYLAARSPEKAKAAIERLQEETNKSAIFLQLDLADLRSVRKASESFLGQESRLDLLFNNGGVMIPSSEMLTVQGHDLQFGTNVIGHFFLTELLFLALAKAHQETNTPARIMNTSSVGHQMAPANGIEFVSLKGGPERDARLYGESKLGNIIISNYFARAHADVLMSCALHPGFVGTDLGRHSGSIMQVAGAALFYSPPMGAYTQLWGATVASPDQINGQYLIPWGTVGKPDARAVNLELEQQTIAYIREQIKGF
ncbi:NAD-binding protein [Mycena galopus ATCC 62051]|nr:NAD-binding protein [Mycena galopus ATCC 62051]